MEFIVSVVVLAVIMLGQILIQNHLLKKNKYIREKELKRNVSARLQAFLDAKKSRRYLLIILFSSLIIRFIFGIAYPPIENDIKMFLTWAREFRIYGFDFYRYAVFCDYPPVCVMLLGWVYGIFSSKFVVVLLSSIGDVLTAYIIYKYAALNKSQNAVFLSFLYLFNPIMLVNSALWCQLDSILIFLIVLTLYLFCIERTAAACVVYSLAFMTKPQALFILPAVLIAILKLKDKKKLFLGATASVITVWSVMLPFNINLFDMYFSSFNRYSTATLNAFNLFYMLGGNGHEFSKIGFFGITYFQLSIALIIILGLFSLFILATSKFDVMYTAVLWCEIIFLFCINMHERYMIFVPALALMAYTSRNDKRLLWVYYLSSAAVYCNVMYIYLRTTTKFGFSQEAIIFTASLYLLSFFYSIEALSIKSKRRRRASSRRTLKMESNKIEAVPKRPEIGKNQFANY